MSQMEKIEKYKVGNPNISPSMLKTNKKGILNTNKRAIDNMMSFCS